MYFKQREADGSTNDVTAAEEETRRDGRGQKKPTIIGTDNWSYLLVQFPIDSIIDNWFLEGCMKGTADLQHQHG